MTLHPGIEKVKAARELPFDGNRDHPARWFHANIAALGFQWHLGTGQKDIAALAEDMVQEIPGLGQKPAN